MRRSLGVLALVLTAAASTSREDLASRVVEFHRHYNPFSRALLGCPKGAREMEECDPRQGSIDYAEYVKARKLAMRLFDLRD
jgi:hypothetical protein